MGIVWERSEETTTGRLCEGWGRGWGQGDGTENSYITVGVSVAWRS